MEDRMEQTDYIKYRGKCQEFVQQAIKDDPTLTAVRGYYWDPIWNTEEPHWWCKRVDGTIYDPTAKQFPTKGMGEYTEFDGTYECDQCGSTVLEEHATFNGNYVFCTYKCAARFVGL